MQQWKKETLRDDRLNPASRCLMSVEVTASKEEAKIRMLSQQQTSYPKQENSEERMATARPKEVILLIHGIRTFAWWQPMVKQVLEEIPNVEVWTTQYEYFGPLRFWCPFWTRERPIQEVREELQKALDAIRDEPGARISVIAHSYGTYVISKLLERDLNLRLHRLIVCGSIIKRRYRWHTLGGRYCSSGIKVINDFGVRDIWPVLAKSLSVGYGDTGRHKFGKSEVLDRAHLFAHADFFKDEAGKGKDFVRKFWKPWFESGTFVESPETERAFSPWWLVALSNLKSIVGIALVVLLMLLIFGYSSSGPPLYEGTMAEYLKARDDRPAGSGERREFFRDNAPMRVKWTGVIVLKGQNAYSVSPHESDAEKVQVVFTPGEFKHIPEGRLISFEGVVVGDLADGILSVEQGCRLKEQTRVP